jgi:hypothetical protein
MAAGNLAKVTHSLPNSGHACTVYFRPRTAVHFNSI